VAPYPKAAAFLLALNFTLGSASAMPDLKFTVRRNYDASGVSGVDTTTSLKPDRKRVEEQQRYRQQLWVGGPGVTLRPSRIATITRCDLGQIFQLNLDDREYASRPIPKPLSEEEKKARAEELKARAAQGPQLQRPARPNLLIEITTTDTGERKQMFGYAARHVITTEKRTPLEGASSPPQEQATDGWYIDLDTSTSCDPPRQPGAFATLSGGRNGKIDYPTVKFVGQRETGFALATSRRDTLFLGDGSRREGAAVNAMQVIDLSSAPMSSELFDVPPRFHEVREIRRRPIMPWWGRALMSLHSVWLGFARALGRPFRRLPSRG
jgi:hypothetical protein